MPALLRQIASAILIAYSLLAAQQLKAEVVATPGKGKLVFLAPLRTEHSALTFVWPIDRMTKSRVEALTAGLSSTLKGGTSSRTPYQIREFVALKGVEHNIGVVGQHLMLTVSAPDDVFPETIVHLENILLKSQYSSGWYERELESLQSGNAVKTRRPTEVLNEVSDFLLYGRDETVDIATGDFFRFGLPSQAILRSEDQEIERRTIQLLNKLPQAQQDWVGKFARWVSTLTADESTPFDLPSGTIYVPDPDSTEMLIVLVKAEKFKDKNAQIGTNLLVDYIGANQGSEMFQIIRQEMRAAYDPRSDFVVLDKNKAIISLSATVKATDWTNVFSRIAEIYKSVRAGEIDPQGVEIRLDLLDRIYGSQFFSEPSWGEEQYILEYPEGTVGTITLPLFDALLAAKPENVVEKSTTLLPPLEDFLLVLIGGGAAPPDAMRTNGFCALPERKTLTFCLEALADGQS
ncbi:MAG: hypothetical protein AAF636_26785 [Pseudomonadota bacterium]